MSDLSIDSDPNRLIPVPELSRRMNCRPVTLRRACIRHGIQIVRLSPHKHALTQADYDLLLSRAKTGDAK
jgi:hypothetical protein